MTLNHNTKVEDLGYLLRTNGYSLSIEYGSGGYSVKITDINSGHYYIEISNDLLDAIQKAFHKAMANKNPQSSTTKTDPGFLKGNSVSIGELSKLLSSGSESNIKF